MISKIYVYHLIRSRIAYAKTIGVNHERLTWLIQAPAP